ncbi:MAG: M23 family metallopeptidase [Lachnospiraceae bacterium]|nr:M23 family metallopeptidase [Lachnospiraceae bacterium]
MAGKKTKRNLNISHSRYCKLCLLAYIRTMMVCFACYCIFFMVFPRYETQGNNRFTIYLNGTQVGTTDDLAKIDLLYMEARREIALQESEPVFIEVPSLTYVGEEVIMESVDADEAIIERMKEILSGSRVETMEHAYSVKVNGTVVNLQSAEAVTQMFQDAVDMYDTGNHYTVELVRDYSRELGVLTANIVGEQQETSEDGNMLFPTAGAAVALAENETFDLVEEGQGFDAFEYGINSMEFSEPIEVVEAYLPVWEIMPEAEAGALLTQKQEMQQIYTVQSGDTLSEISLTVGLPLDEIIALNDELENENTVIRVNQELIITVPEPELSVVWTETARYEEAYDLPIEYIYNDAWYTNQSVTRQQPSAGYHEAAVLVTRRNDTELERETLYEEILFEPVAKVIEVGTIIPPSYIKPISGGRLTSSFGRRNAPTAGASTYHKGVDWATPVGTAVCASSAGTVARAGWGSGYGYVVYINHPNGTQTRYGHLSKIYVSVGQYVNQGDIIAASGNTGRSTGPHLHFEILVNGVQVNPFSYL